MKMALDSPPVVTKQTIVVEISEKGPDVPESFHFSHFQPSTPKFLFWLHHFPLVQTPATSNACRTVGCGGLRRAEAQVQVPKNRPDSLWSPENSTF